MVVVVVYFVLFETASSAGTETLSSNMHTPASKVSGYIVLMIVQIIFLVLYWVFVRYEKALLPAPLNAEDAGSANEHVSKYPRE